MPATEVILREKIEGLGAEADVVKVRRGYARNYLLPRGMAYEATRGNLRHIEHLKQVREEREREELAQAERTAEKLRKLRLTMELSIGQGGKAFGSVTVSDVADLINEKSKLNIDRHQVLLESPIKTLGTFEIPIKVHPTHPASISLRVIAPEKEEKDVEKESDS